MATTTSPIRKTQRRSRSAVTVAHLFPESRTHPRRRSLMPNGHWTAVVDVRPTLDDRRKRWARGAGGCHQRFIRGSGRDDTMWRVRSDRSQFRYELVRRMSRSALAERARKTEMTGEVSAEISQKMFKEWRGVIFRQPLW